jgi:hypothetical protein
MLTIQVNPFDGQSIDQAINVLERLKGGVETKSKVKPAKGPTTDDEEEAPAKPVKVKAAAKIISDEEMREVVGPISKAGKKDAIKKLVASFTNADGDPCENIPQLQQADRADFLSQLKEL